MKTLLRLMGAITLSTVTASSVVACGPKTPPTPDTRTDLNDLITNKNLENIYIGQKDLPIKTEILEAIKQKNKTADFLTENDFDITSSSLTNKNVSIVGKNKYEGTVGLDFKIQNFLKMPKSPGSVNSLLEVNSTLYAGTWNEAGKGKLYKTNDKGIFELVDGWKEDNGAVYSLTVDKIGTVYAGTATADGKGKLFKTNDKGIFELVDGWKEDNGAVFSLTTDKNGTVWIGTEVTITVGNGKLFKINDKGTFELVVGWEQTNGEISSLTSVNNVLYLGTKKDKGTGKVYKFNEGAFTELTGTSGSVSALTVDKSGTVYAGTKTADGKGNLFKTNDKGTFELANGWKEDNGDISSLTSVNNVLYLGTKTGKGTGKVYKFNEDAFTELTGTSGSVSALTVDSQSNVYAGATGVYVSNKI